MKRMLMVIVDEVAEMLLGRKEPEGDKACLVPIGVSERCTEYWSLGSTPGVVLVGGARGKDDVGEGK